MNLPTLLSRNAAAVAHYRQGRLAEASGGLAQALRAMRAGLWRRSAVDDDNNNNNGATGSSFGCTPNRRVGLSTVRPLCRIQDDTIDIYDGAFLVVAVDNDDDDADNRCRQRPLVQLLGVAEIGAVLLFNLGLIDHLRGLNTGRSDCLAAALAIYKQAAGLLKEAAERNDSNNNNNPGGDCCGTAQGSLLLSAALWHNAARLYGASPLPYERALARDATERLAAVVARMGRSGSADEGRASIISDHDYSFFASSVYFSTTIDDRRFAPGA